MNGIFRLDGPFYRIGNIIFYLMVGNILWFIFSIPLITIGASTTALFYMMGKVARDEDPRAFADFWKSFRMNFKQATIAWVILAVVFLIIYTNIRNIGLLGNMAKFIFPVQIAVLLEMVIISVYLFPLLSRYNMTLRQLFKASFFMGNKHILTTLLCLASLAVIFMGFYKIPGLFILVFVALYALVSYYLIHHRVFKKYFPEETKEEPAEEE